MPSSTASRSAADASARASRLCCTWNGRNPAPGIRPASSDRELISAKYCCWRAAFSVVENGKTALARGWGVRKLGDGLSEFLVNGAHADVLLGLREFLPYFQAQAMDVAIIDTPWNGVWQSMKIAAAADPASRAALLAAAEDRRPSARRSSAPTPA